MKNKLTPDQRETIIEMVSQGFKIAKIAKYYRVSRRTIQFLVYPERLVKMKEARLLKLKNQ